jgi:alpha-N-arabinofuranosidase
LQVTRIVLDSAYPIAKVDPRIFGGFLEHLGRGIYDGIYQPRSAKADANGFRKDVLEALRGLNFTAMRYPGGSFVSGYHWLDGIGPRERRPTVRELAWQSIEPNQIGTDEFMSLSKQMKWTPMLSVNLGTGSPEEARNWVEYCNCPVGTRFADLRAENGSKDPYSVKLWCLGNEVDGEWQIGHLPAQPYAILAQQAAKMMKDTDPSIETVASGSSKMSGATYLEWDRTVLEALGPYADYIGLHRYVGNPNDDTVDYLAEPRSVDLRIEHMEAVCRIVQARTHSKKRHGLCFDEWNVWYRHMRAEDTDGKGKFAPALIEEEYNLEDALVMAGFLNSFIRHADSVKIANLAQIVNVIAPIRTRGDEILLQSIYYPFAMMSRRRDGTAIRPVVLGPGYETHTYGHVNFVDASAILGDGLLHAFLINRSTDEPAEIEIDPAGARIEGVDSAEIFSGTDPKAQNTFENPGQILSRPFRAVKIADGKALVRLPPLSFAAVSLRVGPGGRNA